MTNSLTTYVIAFLASVRVSNSFDFSLKLSDELINPSLFVKHFNEFHVGHGEQQSLSRHKRYTYQEPDSKLIGQFEQHLTAREGEEAVGLQQVVDMLVTECDRLSHRALNESIQRYADHNYMVHYNHTETVYRYYRQRYQDYLESLYHKLIFIMPHLVKKHMRTVFLNVTADLKMLNTACMNKFQDLDDRVNTHFLSYGELFRSIMVESYSDIEKNFYAIFTDKPQITGGLTR